MEKNEVNYVEKILHIVSKMSKKQQRFIYLMILTAKK